MKRARNDEEGGLFYRFARAVFSLFFSTVFRMEVKGRENIPEKGSFILCANHINWFDPPLLSCAVGQKRQICFMAKEELFKMPVFNYLIRKLGAFPVKRRKADRRAINHGMEVLKNNKILGLFPEGTRSKTGELQKPYHGSSLIVLRSGVQVLPVAIKGPYRVFRPVKVNIGSPIKFSYDKEERKFKRELIRKVSNDIMEEIKGLLNDI